jgi:hypothetical protein
MGFEVVPLKRRRGGGALTQGVSPMANEVRGAQEELQTAMTDLASAAKEVTEMARKVNNRGHEVISKVKKVVGVVDDQITELDQYCNSLTNDPGDEQAKREAAASVLPASGDAEKS